MSPLTPKLMISGFFGLLYGGIGYLVFIDLPDAGRWAAIIGLSAFGLLLLMMLLKDQHRAYRYKKAEEKLPCAPNFRVGANVRTRRKIFSVIVYLCQDEVILVNVDKKEPVLTRLPRDSVRRAELASPSLLALELTDGRSLLLLSPYMEPLIRELRKIGWLITEKEG